MNSKLPPCSPFFFFVLFLFTLYRAYISSSRLPSLIVLPSLSPGTLSRAISPVKFTLAGATASESSGNERCRRVALTAITLPSTYPSAKPFAQSLVRLSSPLFPRLVVSSCTHTHTSSFFSPLPARPEPPDIRPFLRYSQPVRKPPSRRRPALSPPRPRYTDAVALPSPIGRGYTRAALTKSPSSEIARYYRGYRLSMQRFRLHAVRAYRPRRRQRISRTSIENPERSLLSSPCGNPPAKRRDRRRLECENQFRYNFIDDYDW